MSDVDPRIRKWIEATLGAPIQSAERAASGASRETWFVDVGDRQLVARVDTGDGPVAGTELTLAREASVYRALLDADVAIPRLVAADPDGTALLVERAPGVESIAELDAPSRAALMLDYVDALAALHGVPVGPLELPGFHRPTAPEDHARGELALWRGILQAKVQRPAPLARFAFDWLGRHAPERVERTVLCHGDVGPGNFLHADGRVTALLDWEFAHLGDPMDDLAWLAFRGHHMQPGSVGDLGAQLARWSERTGLPLDAPRIAYYRALVILRFLVACLSALDSGAARLDRSTYFILVPLTRCLLPQALAELAGIELPPAPEPAAGDDAAGEVARAVMSDLFTQIGPAVSDPAAARRIPGLGMLLGHLDAAARLGPTLDAADLADLASVLGRKPTSLTDGLRALEQVVCAESEAKRDEDWIRLFARLGARRMQLWPVARPLAGPLAPIPVPENA